MKLRSICTFAFITSLLVSTFGWADVKFSGDADRISAFEKEFLTYLGELKIDPAWLRIESVIPAEGVHKKARLSYRLRGKYPRGTIELKDHPEFAIKDEKVLKPITEKKSKLTPTVSRKEIVLALFSPGRVTEFTDENATLEIFKDHVGMRQNIVLWADDLSWPWPDEVKAFWNKKFWDKGTPHANVSIVDAFMDAFLHQEHYGIGCYTASKIVMVQGVLDYYARVKKDKKRLKKVIQKLMSDQDPLVDVEPGKMWSFDGDYDPKTDDTPGKILSIQFGISNKNFVPGDWAYFLNDDEDSYAITGFEGSNAIYLGRDRFDDYYNENNHAYTYLEKLDEVYQWRNGVFNRHRDAHKRKPLSPKDYVRLAKTPKKGGLLLDLRVFPSIF